MVQENKIEVPERDQYELDNIELFRDLTHNELEKLKEKQPRLIESAKSYLDIRSTVSEAKLDNGKKQCTLKYIDSKKQHIDVVAMYKSYTGQSNMTLLKWLELFAGLCAISSKKVFDCSAFTQRNGNDKQFILKLQSLLVWIFLERLQIGN